MTASPQLVGSEVLRGDMTASPQLVGSEVLRGLKNFLNRDRPGHHSIDLLRETVGEEESGRQSILLGQR